MTCKDCIHYEACHDMYYEEHATRHFDPEKHNAEKECGYFKDRSRFVELPCKAGDTFSVVIESSDILEYKVSYIGIFHCEVYDDTSIVLDRNDHRIGYTKEQFEYELGKTLFSTKEEAEQALKERET